MQKTLRLLILRFFILLCLGLISYSIAAEAADPAPTNPMCEATLWTQMNQRARLNGQMDIAREENLVTKPDSILEYVCLERFMDSVPAAATSAMANGPLNNLVKPIVQFYIFTNFGHTFRGGRMEPGDPTLPASGDPYDCSAMSYVWHAAHCMNAGDKSPQDDINSLADFLKAPADIRQLPSACEPPDPARLGNAPVTPPTGLTIGGLKPLPDCGVAVPTGNVVDLSSVADGVYDNVFPALPNGGKIYNEKICSNPACHYTPTGVDTGTCATASATP